MSKRKDPRNTRPKLGLCWTCGRPRGADGTKFYCRPHADALRERVRQRYRLGAAVLRAQAEVAEATP